MIDEAGAIVHETKAPSDPASIDAVFAGLDVAVVRIGLEAGPLSQWLHKGLAAAGAPVVCVETRHMKAVLSAALNKTDRGDARGIAQMMRVGLYRPVPHCRTVGKTVASQERRMLLTSRGLLVRKLRDVENDVRGTARGTSASRWGRRAGRASRRASSTWWRTATRWGR